LEQEDLLRLFTIVRVAFLPSSKNKTTQIEFRLIFKSKPLIIMGGFFYGLIQGKRVSFLPQIFIKTELTQIIFYKIKIQLVET